MSLLNQPTTINFLSPINFRFLLKRAPNIDFFCTAANIPSISMTVATQSTPFQKYSRPGHKIERDDLIITFLVNENLADYFEVYNWLIAIGLQDNFDAYKVLAEASPTSDKKIISDATLTILNGVKSPIYNVVYSDIFPYYIDGINFDADVKDINYVKVTAKFKYQKYAITPV